MSLSFLNRLFRHCPVLSVVRCFAISFPYSSRLLRIHNSSCRIRSCWYSARWNAAAVFFKRVSTRFAALLSLKLFDLKIFETLVCWRPTCLCLHLLYYKWPANNLSNSYELNWSKSVQNRNLCFDSISIFKHINKVKKQNKTLRHIVRITGLYI